MIESAVTDLPQPDSPTSPRVSPFRISTLTSSTAGAGPEARSKTVVRCSTVSSAVIDALHARGPAVRALPRAGLGELAEDSAQGVGNLTHRRLGFDGRDHRRDQIGSGSRGVRNRVERCTPGLGAAAGADRPEALNLAAFDFRIDPKKGYGPFFPLEKGAVPLFSARPLFRR